jgi:hypothetical protein
MLRFFATITIIILLILAVIGGTAAGLMYFDREKISADLKTQTQQAQQSQLKVTALEGEVMELKETASGAKLTPESCFSKSASPRIIINQPCQMAEIDKTVSVKGAAWGLFEAVMDYELLVDNVSIDKGFIETGVSMGNLGYVDKTIQLKYPDTARGKEAILRFFETSAQDGSKQHIVEIKVKLK